MKRKRRLILFTLGVAALIWTAWQFMPPPAPPGLPAGYHAHKAAWLGVTWSMDAHSAAEIEALARDLQQHHISTIFVYVSYLRPGDVFNPTFDHARQFVDIMRFAAPDMTLLGWVGVPVQITHPDGKYSEDRLKNPSVRALIAEFSARVVDEIGFDGVHLNAEVVVDGSPSFVAALQAIRAALPPQAILSTTAHPLRLTEQITAVPYPTLASHWSANYLRRVAQHSDQVALMAYDSGLFLPSDYRAWVAFQTRNSAAALAGTDAELLIGVPVSEEWTPSHPVIAETLPNALHGVRTGLAAIPGVEIHADGNDGRLVLTIEDGEGYALPDVFLKLHQLDGVISASLVYQYCDDGLAQETDK